MEEQLQLVARDDARRLVDAAGINDEVLRSALAVKAVAGQINVIVHAVGVLTSLPFVLDEDEVIQSLSLGAGNTGRNHDLETDRRIAEFKFIEWRGGPESIRQNSLFIDLFNLASARTNKRRVLYVTGKAIPMRFLNNRRALSSVLSRNEAVRKRFHELHGDEFHKVREYYEAVKHLVEVVDLQEIVPALRRAKEF